MNVTLELPDSLGREARHRAVDASKPLSAWIVDLVAREVGTAPASPSPGLLAALGDESLDGDMELPDRRTLPHRPLSFP